MTHEHHIGCGHEFTPVEMEHFAEGIGHVCTSGCVHLEQIDILASEQHGHIHDAIGDEMVPQELIDMRNQPEIVTIADIEPDLQIRPNPFDIMRQIDLSQEPEENPKASSDAERTSRNTDRTETSTHTKTKERQETKKVLHTKTINKKQAKPKQVSVSVNASVPKITRTQERKNRDIEHEHARVTKPQEGPVEAVSNIQQVEIDESDEAVITPVVEHFAEEITETFFEDELSFVSLPQPEEMVVDSQIKEDGDSLLEASPLKTDIEVIEKQPAPVLEIKRGKIENLEEVVSEIKAILDFIVNEPVTEELTFEQTRFIKEQVMQSKYLRFIENPTELLKKIVEEQSMNLSDKIFHDLLELIAQATNQNNLIVKPLKSNYILIARKLLGRVVLASTGLRTYQSLSSAS